MKIDLSGALYTQFQKTKEEFEKARDEGNIQAARTKAGGCARILEGLAKQIPSQREMYLEKAEQWRNIASTVEDPILAAQVEHGSGTGGQNSDFAASLLSRSNVTWDDIGGLEDVKKRLIETIVIAYMQKPESIQPDKGIFLFGPPGTGKTLLAAAAAGNLQANFFNVKVSNLLSKYFGESSKLITSLYSYAREHSPAIIFIDEFDALTMSRDADSSEASRKVLSTLLAELDGFQDKKSDRLVLTLAATNVPWDLDEAILSRFPCRVFIPLPDATACREIISIQLRDLDSRSLDLNRISERCVGKNYSGRDLKNLCQEAIKTMVREMNPEIYALRSLSADELRQHMLKVRPLATGDFDKAFERIKSPVTNESLKRYGEWNKAFGEQ